MAENMIKAFKRFGCFVFEAKELERVKDLVVKAEISKHVEVRLVDERYPHIYAVVVSRKNIDKECLSRIESMLSRGELPHNEYKRYKRELLEQCILSMEKERVKEVISVLEKYVAKISGGVT
ncbi:MAG: hypothetical protein QXH02_00385 [Desulfurococcaceae archaeon]